MATTPARDGVYADAIPIGNAIARTAHGAFHVDVQSGDDIIVDVFNHPYT